MRVHQLQPDVCNQALSYCMSCSVRPLTELAADRERAFAEARKAVEAHNAARLKVQSGPKLSDVEGKSLAARRCAHNTHVLFEETSQLFEYKRVADFKRFLQHQIMGEMAFHCAAIEGLTQALQAVGSVDPEVAMDALRDQLVHPATRPEDFEAAATGSSTPFTGFHVPADLQSPMGSAMASYNPATAVAFAAATSPSPARSPSPSPSPYTTGSAPSTLAQPPVSVSAEDAGRGGSTQAHYYHGGVALPGLSVPADAASPGPASAASAGRPSPAASTQPYVTAAAPPGAQYTLSSMPSPWATTPAGIQVPSAAPSPTVGYPSGYSGGPTSSQPSPSPKPTKTGFLGALGFGRRAPTPTPLASPSPSPSTNYTAGHGT